MRLLWVNDERTVFVEAFVEEDHPLALAVRYGYDMHPDEVHVATRPNTNAVWGPPTLLRNEAGR